MNAKTIKRRLKEINEKCPRNGDHEENGRHEDKLYKLVCVIADMFFNGLVSKRTVKQWGKLIAEAEFYPGEAGMNHFSFFN